MAPTKSAVVLGALAFSAPLALAGRDADTITFAVRMDNNTD